MKYKNIELELPPLGEVLIAKTAGGTTVLGYYYLKGEKRDFQKIFTLPNYDSVSSEYGNVVCGSMLCNGTITPAKWAKIPKLKSLKKQRPPIGTEVILSTVSKYGRGYTNGTNLKDYVLEDRINDSDDKKVTIDSWLEVEAFKEDKE